MEEITSVVEYTEKIEELFDKKPDMRSKEYDEWVTEITPLIEGCNKLAKMELYGLPARKNTKKLCKSKRSVTVGDVPGGKQPDRTRCTDEISEDDHCRCRDAKSSGNNTEGEVST